MTSFCTSIAQFARPVLSRAAKPAPNLAMREFTSVSLRTERITLLSFSMMALAPSLFPMITCRPKPLGELRGDDAGKFIGTTAGGISHYRFDRLIRITLCRRFATNEGGRASQDQDFFHSGVSPDVFPAIFLTAAAAIFRHSFTAIALWSRIVAETGACYIISILSTSLLHFCPAFA